MAQLSHKVFSFTTELNGEKIAFQTAIQFPFMQNVEEFAIRLANSHNLPVDSVHSAMTDELKKFISVEKRNIENQNAEEAIQKVRSGEVGIDTLASQWEKAFSQEVAQYAEPEPVTNEKVFGEVYHTLIHSPSLETLLNLEQTYGVTVVKKIEKRDRDMQHLEKRQQDEMEDAITKLGTFYTDEQINQMAQRHFENIQMIESKWASELSNLQQTQKREFQHWVMNLHQDTQLTNTTPAYVHHVNSLSNKSTKEKPWKDDTVPAVRKEESFTVHLGAQMKTMHNLRLVSADILQLCRHKPAVNEGGMLLPQPQRLQTALALYSTKLCGLVLIVDDRLNSYSGIKREFARTCERATEFHFRCLADQLEVVEEAVLRANEWRAQRKAADEGDRGSVKSLGSDRVSLRSNASGSSDREERSIKMQPGDFYITRHSNLAEVHNVFHLVSDGSVRTPQADISSRHPVILGYRNVLRACYRYDIRSVILPLLLVHDMSEEMTISWCMKRAELIFKCVKGFVMEFATWSSQESMTIQFVVPQGLSDETFSAISAMLPSIFRMSNPVVAKS